MTIYVLRYMDIDQFGCSQPEIWEEQCYTDDHMVAIKWMWQTTRDRHYDYIKLEKLQTGKETP